MARPPDPAPDIPSPAPTAPKPSRRSPAHLLLAALRLVLRAVCAVAIVLDEVVRPLYAPLARWVAGLGLVQAFERWIVGLSPYWVLVLIGVPYVVVEPLKFAALLVIANGHVKSGTLVFLLANLVSFILIERIFRAGRPQLMTLKPVAWLVETVAGVRRALFAYLRIAELKARARVIWRWARLHLRLRAR